MHDINAAQIQESHSSLSQNLARYVHELSFQDLPVDVVHEVKRRLLDTIGCAYGAQQSAPCRIARRLAERVSMKNGATIWGTHHHTTPELASFANGSLVRYLDFNDTYLSKEPAHPSDNIPACLAVAESVHASGQECILAIVIAYEIQCRLCDAAALRPLGWDHVTYGAFSTALAASRLLRLTPVQTAQAVQIAGLTAGALRQTRVGEVSSWKACAFANAGRNGVFAALAAQEGMTGPPELFEGEKGFMRIISGPFSLPVLGGKSGMPFKILDTYIKQYPVEYHAQSAVEAALQIRQTIIDDQERFSSTRVTKIEAQSFDVAIEIIGREPEKWHPQTRETADHSLPYCIAVALMDGRISPQSFSPKRLRDKSLQALIQKVRVSEQPDFSSRYPDAMPIQLRVCTRNNRAYTAQVEIPYGHPLRSLSDQELEQKFHSLADRKIGIDNANRLIERVWNLDRLADAGHLVQSFPTSAKHQMAS